MRAKELNQLPKGVTVYVDMDGVLADLFNYAGEINNVEHYNKMTPDQWEKFFKDSNAYELFKGLPAFPTANKLLEMVKSFAGGYKILSSPLNFDKAGSIKGKKEWLSKHINVPADAWVFEHEKQMYANTNGVPNILIDDYGVNIRKWQAAGGIAIKYQADEDSLKKVLDGLRDAKEILSNTPTENIDEARRKKKRSRWAAYGPGPYGYYGTAVGYSGDGGIGGDSAGGEDRHVNDPPYGPETKPTMPKGTVKVDVSDVYDWYKLGMHIANLKGLGKHDFGKGPPSTILSFGDEEEEHKYIQDLEKTGLTTTDIDPVDPKQPKGMKRQKTDPRYNVGEDAEPMDREFALVKKLGRLGQRIVQNPKLWDRYDEENDSGNPDWIISLIMDGTGATFDEVLKLSDLFSEIGGGMGRIIDFAWAVKEGTWEEDFMDPYRKHRDQAVGENFADGKNPQDKGDSKRHGINTKASVSSLRKTAKNSSGRKRELAHWLANMKSGRNK